MRVYDENYAAKLSAEPVDCPHCNNQGWYADANRHTGEPEQIQCEFCYTTPNSRFNYDQSRSAIAKTAGGVK